MNLDAPARVCKCGHPLTQHRSDWDDESVWLHCDGAPLADPSTSEPCDGPHEIPWPPESTSVADATLPEQLCGEWDREARDTGRCVFLKLHEGNHSWKK